jgi:hypothetical protein
MSFRHERIGFRFLNLPRDISERLRTLAANSTVRPQHGQLDRYVVSFWLEPSNNYDWIEHAIQEHELSEADYGLFASLVTESDSDMMAVPDFVKALFRRVGGRLEFSFTSVEPNDLSSGSH